MFWILAGSLIGMQAVDCSFTMWAVGTQRCIEGNALMIPIYAHMWPAPIVKLLPALLAVAFLRTSFVQNNRAYRLAGNAGLFAGSIFLAIVTYLNVLQLP